MNFKQKIFKTMNFNSMKRIVLCAYADKCKHGECTGTASLQDQ